MLTSRPGLVTPRHIDIASRTRRRGEAVLHIGVETLFLNVGMPLWGWASDNLRSRYGTLTFCVRPVGLSTQLPHGVGPMPSYAGGRSRSKLLGGVDMQAVIDILCEPLGEDSVPLLARGSTSRLSCASTAAPPFSPSSVSRVFCFCL